MYRQGLKFAVEIPAKARTFSGSSISVGPSMMF